MDVDEGRWHRLQAVFHAAVGLPADEREAYVHSECATDPSMVSEVLAMLEEDARTSLLERGLGSMAGGVLDGSVRALERIGPYRILGVAGHGGMGVVYAAEREDLGSRAAIKVLRDATLSPMRRERFASEQRLLAQLDHPCIARLFDADTLTDGTPYFVMEYVDGVPLTEHARARRLSIRRRLELFLDVCAGVQHAHAEAVVHRDLKPSNILVRADGAVKLLDFGIAKQLEGLDAAVERTQTAFRLMTPSYAAPEQILGGAVGTYTDVYSLGVVLYELLTGRLPFDASDLTPGQLEAAILGQLPERPSRVAPGALTAPPDAHQLGASPWADLDVICRTAMHRDPERRYRTVDALARDVERFLAREPVEARGDSVLYRLDRFVRRHPKPLTAVAAGVMMLLGLSVYYTLSLAAARDEALLESARARQTQEFMLSLFQGGDPTLGPTDTLRVVSLLERGLQEAGLLDEQPRLQAEVYATLGGIFHQLGDLPRADSLLRLALEQRRATLGEVHAEVASSLVALGRLRADQARVEEGEALIRDGLEMSRRVRPTRPADVAAAAAALGEVLRDRGAHSEAVAALQEAVRLHGPEPTPALALALGALAGTHFYAGAYEVSDTLSRRVLELHRRLRGPRHPHVADALINLGAIQFEQGRYRDAEDHYRQATEIKLAVYGEDHHQIAAARTMLGRALVAQERYGEALAELEPALRTRERVFGPVHPAVASTLNDLGIVRTSAGDLAGAELNYRRMLSIYQDVYGGTHAFSGIAMSNLANVYDEMGDHARAEQMLRQAIEQFTGALGLEHSNTAIALIKLGTVLRRQERWAEAIQALRSGYDSLSPQAAPGSRFLQIARRNLAQAYEAIGERDEARRWDAAHAEHAEPIDS
jgi:eukaryotic-like serine/threonine-protein kinase